MNPKGVFGYWFWLSLLFGICALAIYPDNGIGRLLFAIAVSGVIQFNNPDDYYNNGE